MNQTAVPMMYPVKYPNSPLTSSSECGSSNVSTASSSSSSGFIQPWLNSKSSPVNMNCGNLSETPPSSSSTMRQQHMNMLHPIYMYSSPYYQSINQSMMYPYSSMFNQHIPAGITQHIPAGITQHIPAGITQQQTQSDNISPVNKKTYSSPNSSIAQPKNAISPMHPTPAQLYPTDTSSVHGRPEIHRTNRRSSLSSDCSSSTSDTAESSSSTSDTGDNRTDISVEVSVNDIEISQSNDSGNCSLGSESPSFSVPEIDPLRVTKVPENKIATPAKTPEPLYKKKARTNYTPEQVRGLEQIFLTTPYPEPEAMEKVSRDLDIPEQKLKVWFQNKRARWRRRMQDSKHQLLSSVIPPVYMPPMMSPYGTMPPSMNPYYMYQETANGPFNSSIQKYRLP